MKGTRPPTWTILDVTKQTKIVFLKIGDKASALKYIEASDAYLIDTNHRRSMKFQDWPSIVDSCPVCGRAQCAVYRGYYSRFLFCTELEFTGRLVHRTGFCKSTKTRFSLTPDFILPRRRISRFTHDRLLEARLQSATIRAAIDDLTSDLGEEFFLPVSTAHIYLHLTAPQAP